ncbi:putative ATP-grasp-modified RiPP [Streptomyces violascens]|uniref:putative ATP-grasp-modified RiPP n=1 Tax=Streptomyces violascens TaxID=67381 RepID=UPI0036480859
MGLRPYALVGARLHVTALSAPRVETRIYDPVTQTAALADGTPLIAMASSQKTNPDGDMKNPPPSDEGPDPGFIE